MQRLESERVQALIEEGVLAAKEGRALSSNPYPWLSSPYEAWRAGWFKYVNAEQLCPDTLFA